jgi:hypothetical protein
MRFMLSLLFSGVNLAIVNSNDEMASPVRSDFALSQIIFALATGQRGG